MSLTVPAQQIVGLFGLNGAGKTTVMRILSGILPADSGTVSLNGYDLMREREPALQQVAVALQEDDHSHAWGSVWEETGPAPDEQCLRDLGLWPHRDDPLETLSPGLRRRVTLARAWAARAPILLLDEPTLGLDEYAARTVEAHIRQQVEREQKTVLVATRNAQLIDALCDRVVTLQEGRLTADMPANRHLGLSQRAIYHIKVKGVLEARWTHWFDGLTVTPLSDETLICGPIVDQPALHSLLVKIRDLGLPLVSVQYVAPNTAEVLLQLDERPATLAQR